MIVVRVELWPAEDDKPKQTLGVMTITNDGSGDLDVRHYDGAVMTKPDFKKVTRRSRVMHWRAQQKTIWHLVGRMLSNMGYG